MQDNAEHRETSGHRGHRISPERLPELFGAQFFRFLPGLEASGASVTQEPSLSTTASSSVGSAESRQLYSVQLPSLTSASSRMAGSEEEALAVDSGDGRQLLKVYSIPTLTRTATSAGSVASGSEADTMDSSTRTFLAVRRSRILGMPMTYYALLMASMVLCAFSYSYASRTMRERSANFAGHGHGVAKKGQGALLKAPLPQSSTRGQDLAYVTRHEHLPSVRVHGARRRSPCEGPQEQEVRAALAARLGPRRNDQRLRRTTWTRRGTLRPTACHRLPGSLLSWRRRPATVEATVTRRSAPASLPPAVTLTGGDVPQNGTFNSSANLDEYEEVVEYYYMYDDNDTSASSMQRPTRYAELAIPINI
ncbi:hypothetical protein MRX96_041837 [Rhipicephalus microplus]